jgi:hypothetical protein
MANFATEVVFIALITGIVGLAISTCLMYGNKNFTLKTYTFWPQVFLSFVLTGAVMHIMFEYSGANTWYCKNGHACV